MSTCLGIVHAVIGAHENFAGADQSVIIDVIETREAFVGALDSPIDSETLVMTLNEVTDSRITKRQASTITIEVDVTPGKYLVVIPKSKLNMLVRGRSYGFLVSWSAEIRLVGNVLHAD